MKIRYHRKKNSEAVKANNIIQNVAGSIRIHVNISAMELIMSKYVFTCYHCGSESGYSRKKPGELVFEFKKRRVDSKKRIYICESCDSENEIENSPEEWRLIDKG